jgi:hypothetical protein
MKINKLAETEKAYIAGLFDGEGTVDYARRWERRKKNGKKYKLWRISSSVAMTDKYVIEYLHETLGFGTVVPIKVPKGMKPQWRWRCTFRDSLQLAKLLWPYAQVKLHKFEQILDHYADMDPTKKKHSPSAQIIYLHERRNQVHYEKK